MLILVYVIYWSILMKYCVKIVLGFGGCNVVIVLFLLEYILFKDEDNILFEI